MNDGHNAALEKIPQIQIDFQVHLEYVSDSTLDMHFMHEFMCMCYLSISSTIMHLLHVCVCVNRQFLHFYTFMEMASVIADIQCEIERNFECYSKSQTRILIQSASILCMWAYTDQKKILKSEKFDFIQQTASKLPYRMNYVHYICVLLASFFFCVAPVCHVLAIVLHFVAKL